MTTTITKREHRMPFGTQLHAEGVSFRLWAPAARRIDVLISRPDGGGAGDDIAVAMSAVGGGWFEAFVAGVGAGARYTYRIDGGLTVPDPASRSNPDDVHGPSVVVDPNTYAWRDGAWRGRPWHEAVLYELHVGTFTSQGTFAAAIDKLDALIDVGITAIELMPVADFPGRRNWGYDGALPFAPDAAYGTPDDLKRLVDEAHARGLMVLLDVVYNHFGPDGNYLAVYAPRFFATGRGTPWGAAIDFGPRVVRDFYRHNALYWIEEFHLDGLRLDAIDQIVDTHRPDIVQEIAQAIRAGPGRERHVHVTVENDHNDAQLLARTTENAPRWATAQWNDDFHHAAHVLATGAGEGHYQDYTAHPLAHLGRALAEGFAYQGQPSRYRRGRTRGEPSAHLPPEAFVNFLQNHDQVGNQPSGTRLDRLAPPHRTEALLACLLLAPAPPLLFMGEEWGAATPFLFFCDFGAELAEAVRAGRRAGFARLAQFADAQALAALPDPNDPASFAASKLDWTERDRPEHARRLAQVRQLLALRQRWITPRLPGMRAGGSATLAGADGLRVTWTLGDASRLTLDALLPQTTGQGGTEALPAAPGQVIYRTPADAAPHPAAWVVRWSIVSAPHAP